MKKLSIVLSAALALAAFTTAGVTPTLAQSSTAWSNGNVRPLVHMLPADRSGYSAYGQRPNNWSPFIGPEIWGH
jgi:hypothetical protein